MGRTIVSFCDICGKRTSELVGKLTLLKQDNKETHRYFTVWTKKTCKRCLNKMTNVKTKGDIIQERIDLSLDKEYIKIQKEEVKSLFEK